MTNTFDTEVLLQEAEGMGEVSTAAAAEPQDDIEPFEFATPLNEVDDNGE